LVTGYLIIDRFGLNLDFIKKHRLSWIPNLETGRGKYPLNDRRHKQHHHAHVQEYLRTVGVRKVEANALITRPEAGRELCRQAIAKYLPSTALREFNSAVELKREEMRRALAKLMASEFGTRKK
jgi:hypothetical protein